jgi:putative phosphoribosyl transferase
MKIDPPFRDRIDAGAALAKSLDAYRRCDTLVLGIPRGGVVVAAEIARLFEVELDVVVARKLGAPGQPELAIGAVTADGGRFLNEDTMQALHISAPYLDAVTRVQMTEARHREIWLRNLRPAAPIADRVVIVVDDGLATGSTMLAAARALRQRGPARLVAAAPVGSREACTALRAEVDEVVCPLQPEPFGAVGFYYRYFEPVEDEQVRNLLEATRAQSFQSPVEVTQQV